MRSTLLVLLLFGGVSVASAAEEVDWHGLLNAKALRCALPFGAMARWDSGKPRISQSGPDANFILIFESIDHTRGTARLIGNQATSNVMAFHTPAGLHFIEQTNFGSVMITSVFPRLTSDGFMAVHSRHLATLAGQPIPSQAYGTCKVLE